MVPKFTPEDLARANALWGCNCGPASFAVASGLTLDEARKCFPDFSGWCNTTMMRTAVQALYANPANARESWRSCGNDDLFGKEPRIVRIEFTGPWTGTQWAVHRSHWVATWREAHCGIESEFVYDVNGGMQRRQHWEYSTLPLLIAQHKHARGWKATNYFIVAAPEVRAEKRMLAQQVVKA